jgi:hypothetical protein
MPGWQKVVFGELGGVDQAQRREGHRDDKQVGGFSTPFAYFAVLNHAAWFPPCRRD